MSRPIAMAGAIVVAGAENSGGTAGGVRCGRLGPRCPARLSTARLAQVHLEVAELDIGISLVIFERLVVDLRPAIVLGRAAERLSMTLVLALAVDAAIRIGQGVQPRLGD